jgi:uncharacterized surface anchored protein
MPLNISLQNNHETALIEIYTTDGRILKRESTNQTSYKMNVEFLTKGTYLLRVSNRQKVYTAKFVKH